MTQRLSDNVVEMLVNPAAPLAAQKAATDLLSLRAAVRRWIKASEDARDAPIGSGWSLVDYDEACAALRAEMGGIDKDGGS